jgi:hypothetical protein
MTGAVRFAADDAGAGKWGLLAAGVAGVRLLAPKKELPPPTLPKLEKKEDMEMYRIVYVARD